MQKLGIIGGLGPMATALFIEMVIEMTVEKDEKCGIELYTFLVRCCCLPVCHI